MALGRVHLELPKIPRIEHLLAPLINGECRFLPDDADGGELTDEYGFATKSFGNSNGIFFPCIWVGKKIDERLVADQPRAVAGYEITVQQTIGAVPTIFTENGKLDLKLQIGANEFQTLEIIAVINQTNIFWQIFATDIDE